MLRNGRKTIQEYKGPREAEGIVEYLKKQSGSTSAEIKTIDDATTLVSDKKIVIVSVFKEFSGEAYNNFSALAEKLRSDYEFGHTLDAKLIPRDPQKEVKDVIGEVSGVEQVQFGAASAIQRGEQRMSGEIKKSKWVVSKRLSKQLSL
ncbi:hypothetical protein COP2_022798 [Malus domestica]